MTTVATSEILNRAADLIEERGWTSGPRGMEVDGPLCLEGAIGAVIGAEVIGGLRPFYAYSDVEACPAGTAVIAYLGEQHPDQWNDRPGRTATEVIEVLRAVAVIEAARKEERAEVTR